MTQAIESQESANRRILALYKTDNLAHAMLDNLFYAYTGNCQEKEAAQRNFVAQTLAAFYGRDLAGKAWDDLLRRLERALDTYCRNRYKFENIELDTSYRL